MSSKRTQYAGTKPQKEKRKQSAQVVAVSRQHEPKLVYYSASTMGIDSISTSNTTYNLGINIGQGTDYFAQRIGRRVRVTSVEFHGQLLGGQTNSVADDPYDAVRVTVTVGRTGFAPAWAVNQPLDPRAMAGLLYVIYDRTFVMNTNAKDSTGYIAKALQMDFKRSLDTLLEWTATAAGAPSTMSIFLSVVSDSAAVVHPGFAASTYAMLTYEDA